MNSVTGISSRADTAIATVRLGSFRFSTGICAITGGWERRPMASASTSSRTQNRAYSPNCFSPNAVRPLAVTALERSVLLAAYRKMAIAPAPLTAASALRHRGSFFGFQSGVSSSGSGKGGASSGSSGMGGTWPPQTVITSSAVTAWGSRGRAMRLAAVV